MRDEMVVKCTECRFDKVVAVDAEPAPADVLLAHEDETGHRLKLSPLNE
jgi:hypothetical protein